MSAKATDIFAGLNPEQNEAAHAIYGPILTSAPAGAGKTKVLTVRAQYMIMQGINPANMLLTTFTNKAANEIKERIINVVGDEGKKITVGTYHSICNRILRQYGEHIGYAKTFSILSEDESEKVMKKAAKQYALEMKDLKAYISNKKAKAITATQAVSTASTAECDMANAYQIYQQELKRSQAMDFDDLLLNTVLLLEQHSDVKQAINNKWQYLSMDEIQDSSILDNKLGYLLAGTNQNIFMVGDLNQSIYGFRGSEIETIINLKNQYPNLRTIGLVTNYRSTETIVNAGESLIAKNKVKANNHTKSGRGVEGSKIIQTKCKNQEDEANKMVTYIKFVHDKRNVPYSEIAVLYRMTYLSRNLEQALMKERIPYTLIGGVPFFCRAEILDILSYLKLIVNEYDFTAFKRSIGIPKRGIGEKSIENIDEFARTFPGKELSIREAISHKDLKLRGKADKAIKEYAKFLDLLETKYLELAPSELITWLVTELEYVDYLKATYKEDSEVQTRVENLMELVNVASEYDSIEDLLVQASLYREDVEDKTDAVQLLTMHKSKGLEYKAVITVGCAEGISPHYKALEDHKQLEEERRLMYVAMTRAKDYLFMTYPSSVKMQGMDTYAKPSRFLNEIDSKYVHKN